MDELKEKGYLEEIKEGDNYRIRFNKDLVRLTFECESESSLDVIVTKK